MTEDRSPGGGGATGWLLDFACVAVVLLANPVFHAFGNGIAGSFTPDSSLYASMARSLADSGALFVEGWGHVDRGVILPPLLPAFIALGSLFDADPMRVAVAVSGLAALATGIGCYFLVAGLSNRGVAVVAVLAVQVGEFYFQSAFKAMTESLFTAACVLTIVLLWQYLARNRSGLGLALGVACGLTFLSRKSGSFVCAFCLLWVAIDWWWRIPRRELPVLGRRFLTVVAGLLLLLAPYAIALYAQTGQQPLQPRFRLGNYSVTSDDPVVVNEIRELLDERDAGDYKSIYRTRRKLRKLLPDGSETYESLTPAPWIEASESVPVRVLQEATDDPSAVPVRLWTNIGHLRDALGNPLVALFLLCSLTPLVQRLFRPIPPERFLLAAFVWSYLGAVSIVTDLVVRYAVVVAPFVVIHVAIELYALACMLLRRRMLPGVLAASLLVLATTAAPKRFDSVRLHSPRRGTASGELRNHIRQGDPVFAMQPHDVFVMGGIFRALPDAPLPLVVRYAQLTGVRWLLISTNRKSAKQISMYENRWYSHPKNERAEEFGSLLEEQAVTRNGKVTLYRIHAD
jgi:4-amino-4-deoxy-L-arabinose transferase-like glycosyltransferase